MTVKEQIDQPKTFNTQLMELTDQLKQNVALIEAYGKRQRRLLTLQTAVLIIMSLVVVAGVINLILWIVR